MVANAPSLLITDDDLDFRETLRGVFEPRGFHTLTAGDGEEALEILKHETVHLALFDMHMPRLSGLDAIRRLKELYRPLPCILLSAEADEQLIAEAREARAFDVLRKPVTRDRVINVVQLALETSYERGDWRRPARFVRRRVFFDRPDREPLSGERRRILSSLRSQSVIFPGLWAP
ncbi:MAG: response regulator [Pirellulales bacterium]